jgi:hypothetical protein
MKNLSERKTKMEIKNTSSLNKRIVLKRINNALHHESQSCANKKVLSFFGNSSQQTNGLSRSQLLSPYTSEQSDYEHNSTKTNSHASNDGAAQMIHIDTNTRRAMLTTSDNPYDPFDNFDAWYAYDESKNYNSCSYLARIARTSDELSEADNELAIEKAIDEIIEFNILGLYRKVVKDTVAS